MSLYTKNTQIGGPDDIFDMEKLAGKKLPKEEGKWAAELHSWLKEEYPYLDRYSINVTFKNIDSDRGYAVGSGTVARGFMGSAKKDGTRTVVPVGPVVHIPVVVQNFKPVVTKTFSDGKRYRVLTERNVNAAMSGPAGAYRSVPSSSHDSASGDSFYTPPDRAEEGYSGDRASVTTKVASVVATEEERAHARGYGHWITEELDKPVYAGSVVERTGSKYVVHDVFEKQGELQYQKVELTYPEAVAQDLAFREGRFKTLRHRGSSVELTKEAALGLESPKQLTESGSCYVYGQDGTPVEGVLVSEVRELDGSAYPGSLLMTKEGFAMGPEFYGGPLGITPDVNDVHTTGGLATFLYKNAATAPIHIDTWEEDIGGSGFTGRDMLGREVVGRFADVKNPVEFNTREYLIPKTASCVPLGKAFKPLGESEAKAVVGETIKKEARLVFDGSSYYIPGHDYMNEGQIRAHLAAYGAGPVETEVLLKTAHVHGTVAFYPTPFDAPDPEITSVSHDRLLPWVNAEVVDTIIAGTRLIKESGLVEDKMTVDNILDLQFVTPDNIRLFTDQIDGYNDTISSLCQLSLGSNLGAEVDGDVAMRAADYMDRVVHQLGQQKPYTETV